MSDGPTSGVVARWAFSLSRRMRGVGVALVAAAVLLNAGAAAVGASEGDAGPDEAEGLEGGEELPGDPLGPAEDVWSAAAIFGDDGWWVWDDGDRGVPVRPLGEGEVAEWLGEEGAKAVLPDFDGNGTSVFEGARWVATDTGQVMALRGGVIVQFQPGTTDARARGVLADHDAGGGSVSVLGGLADSYYVATGSPLEALLIADALAGELSVRSVSPDWILPLGVDSSSGADVDSPTVGYCTGFRAWLSDRLSGCLWHLRSDTDYRGPNGHDPVVDVNVVDAWGVSRGEGVNVAIVDSRIDHRHEDLAPNLRTDKGTNYPSVTGGGRSEHGTRVAGVAAAADNDLGSRGVAPRATIYPYNLLSNYTLANQIDSLTRHKEEVGVSNHSYGQKGLNTGRLIRAPSLLISALESGLTHGYSGRGTVQVAAAGNSKESGWYRLVGMAEFRNHRGIVNVCAVNHAGESSDYSSEGDNLWVCAPSSSRSSSLSKNILTTTGHSEYTRFFWGTSAAAPMVSGVVALMRGVNAELTWRDVKLILADTARRNDPSDSSWSTGASKYSDADHRYHYSHKYGFGLVDASAAVDLAFEWPLLPAMQTASASTSVTYRILEDRQVVEIPLTLSTSIDFVEHVDVELGLWTEFARDLDIRLVSPAGTESLLLEPWGGGYGCRLPCGISGSFNFSSTRHLGEDPSGTWKLRISDQFPSRRNTAGPSWGEFAEVRTATLTVYGHSGQSTDGRPRLRLSVDGGTGIDVDADEGETVTVGATLSGGTFTSDLVVPISVSAGTATVTGAGADITSLASVTIPAGKAQGSGAIEVLDDGRAEPDETFKVGLGATPSGVLALGAPFTVTIAGDDPVPEVTVTEGGPATEGEAATFTITAAPAPKAPLTVNLLVSQQGDFVAAADLGSHSVTVPTGGTAQFAVDIVDDGYAEPDGSVRVAVWNGEGYRIAVGQGSAAVPVDDTDDEGTVVSIAGGGTVTEGDAATFTLTTDSAPDAPLMVSLLVSQSGDYVASGDLGARTVTVPISGSAMFWVATVDDSVYELNGSVTVRVTPGLRYAVSSSQDSATKTVWSEDVPEISITTSDSAVTEGGSAVFTVTSTPTPIKPLTVILAVTWRGSYKVPGILSSRRLEFLPRNGSYSRSMQIWEATHDDKVDERDGLMKVRVVGSHAYTVSATQGSADVVVRDNDAPLVVSVVGGAGVSEGGTASYTVSAVPAPSAPLTVSLTVAQQGDFVAAGATGSHSVTIPTSGSAPYTVATIDDEVDEADGSVTVTAKAGSGYIVSSNMRAASVAVSDDDDPPPDDTPVVGVAAGPGVTEGDGAVFTLTADPAPSAPLTVSLAVAQTGDFGVSTGARTVTIPASGSVTQSFATVDDDVAEPDGSVTVTVNAGSGYKVSSAQGAATVAVADDDLPGPEVGVTAVAVTLTEGDDARFTVTASPAPSSPLTVSLQVLQIGDHLAPGAAGVQQVTIPVSGSAQHSVATDDDAVAERNGMIIVMVARDSGYTVSRSRISAGAVVYDNDARSRTPTPRISVTAGAGITEGGSAAFAVTADPAPAAPLTVRVAVGQTGDYAAPGTTGTKTVRVPTSGSVSHTVATIDDSADEADGSVTVTVNTGQGYSVSSSQGAATVAVSDDDDPPVTPTPEISVTAGGGITEGGDAGFTVTASPAPKAPLAVSVTVTQSGDYGVSTGTKTVTIPASGSVAHAVATDDDSVDEADGSVTVTVNTGQGYSVSSSQGAATVAVSDDDDPPVTPTPEVSVTAGPGVTEGTSASFTVTASPAPASPLSVSLTVTQTGDFGVSTGAKTVTVPTSGAKSYTVATAGDSVDEADGSVTVTVNTGQGYSVSSSQGSATVAVSDDDDPPPVPQTCVTADTALLAQVLAKTRDPWNGGRPDLLETFTRSYNTMLGTDTYTVAALKARPDRQEPNWQGNGPNALWQKVYAELDRLEACRATPRTPTPPPPPTPTPEISVTAGAGITEGGGAAFTVTASPAPAAALSVGVTVTQQGDYGVSTGSKTVVIPTGGTARLTVSTADDNADEADGSVTVTLDAGQGYTVSTAHGAASVAVSDDDLPPSPPPPPPPPPPTPEVGVTAGAAVTEGGSAAFTVTANPAPAAPLPVSVTVTQSGDYGASTGTKTVIVPTSGTKSYTVATANDSTDEADGSVTVTLNAGSGYTVSSSQGSATVAVSDGDATTVTLAAVAGAAIAEDGGTREITVTAGRALAAGETLTAPLAVTGATAGGHYTLALKQGQGVNDHVTLLTDGPHSAQNPAVVLAAGGQQATLVLVALPNDDTAERTVAVALAAGRLAPSGQGLSGGVTAVGGPIATAITNDDQPPPAGLPAITIDTRYSRAGEDTGAITFVVVLSEASTRTVTVGYQTQEGTAYDYLDYPGARGRLTFRPGTTRRGITVIPNADNRREADETFQLVLSDPVGATLTDRTATGTIIDDD
ncbi:MAG: S8 family serine peptidase [bacterium]|nr:S8 family serine peptidase [bacterium]